MRDKVKKICFIAPKFLRCIGGVESHGYEFAKEFQRDKKFKIVSIISKNKVKDGVSIEKRNSEKALERITRRVLTSDMKNDAELILNNSPKDTKIYFLNNPNWLPVIPIIKQSRSKCKVFVRSGGNDLMAGWIGEEDDFESTIKANRKILVEIINNNVDKLIVNSNYSMKRMLSLGISKNKLIKIKGGVDCKRFHPNKRKRSGKEISIGIISRLVEFKGIEYGLKSIEKVSKLTPIKVRYFVMGDGPFKNKLKELSKSLGISNIVEFVDSENYGKVDKYFKKLDIFLHLPIHLLKKERGSQYIHTETMGRCLCEASASGIPAVISDVGGAPEIIKKNKSGFVVKEKDFKSASEKILKLIRNKELRLSMGKKGREISLKKYDWPIVFSKYREMFSK